MNPERFRKMYSLIDRVRLIVIVGIFGFIVSIGAVQIFMRYTPGINALSWVDEIMRYLNIWLVLLSASVGVKYGSHLKMDYLLNKYVPAGWIRIISVVTEILVISALIILILFGTMRVMDNRNTVIQSLSLSIAYFYAAIPVGGCLILMEYLLICLYKGHPFAQPPGCTDTTGS